MGRMIKASKFDKRIVLQKLKQPEKNERGQVIRNGSVRIDEWQNIKTVWASIEPIQGREYFSGVFQVGENVIRVRMRYQPNLQITAKMRVKYGKRVFDIENVIDSKEVHNELQLMCKEILK